MDASQAVTLRAATVDDCNAVYRMMCELESETFDQVSFEQTFKANLKDERVGYWIAETGGRPVGFISLHIERVLHRRGPIAEIQELFVQSDQRSKGLGTLLVAHARAEAKRQGCVRLQVATNMKRERAQQFYERCGFERTHYKFTETL